MTYCNDIDDMDEGDSAYATTIAGDHYIEMTNECMSTSTRAPRHVWTKEEEGTFVECLMDLVSMGNGNPIKIRSSQVTWPNWPSQKCGSQRAVALGGTMKRNA
ncbi:retrotransposon protein [Cucumis melo var. makuwa]|uniref:Retrotransposon protein n=1 Tax=Cucumis melo var. makuwa TaxID=1194695 RepID=A0A5D3CAP9_CUCMM|nr:retrotransposon protein [Cucumis melo var. makuwa]TYK07389.1 retrotransposon protein [Cucumis melo var. makuwa]